MISTIWLQVNGAATTARRRIDGIDFFNGNFVLENFDDYKHLRGGIYFLDAFPSSVGGKFLRREIRKTVMNLVNALN